MIRGSNISEEDLSDTPGAPRPAKEYEYRPYRRLATAVIRKSVGDAIRCRYGRKPRKPVARREMETSEPFLYSQVPYWRRQRTFWFSMAGIVNNPDTVDKLVKYYREHMSELKEEA